MSNLPRAMSRYLRSTTRSPDSAWDGYAEVTAVSRRNEKGERQYRLKYLVVKSFVRGTQLWTQDELESSEVRWLLHRPASWAGIR